MAASDLTSDDLAFTSVAALVQQLRSGALTSVDLVDSLLERIDRLDGQLSGFVEVRAAQARAEAALADQARGQGDERPLLGLPIAVKNNVAVAGGATRHGTSSPELAAARDSDLVAALRSAGCLVLGLTSMSELALHPYGPARNPWDLQRTAGGSPGGSAAAVAAGLVPAATASDGAGSIRIPAASCGIFGLKPTPGLLPEGPGRTGWHGLAALGFMTRGVLDTALLLDGVLGSSGLGSEAYATAAMAGSDEPLRIAVSRRPFLRVPVSADAERVLRETVARLGGLGHRVSRKDPSYGWLPPAFVPRYLRSARDSAVRLVDPHAMSAAARRPARLGSRVSLREIERSRERGQRWTAAVTDEVFADADVLLTPALPGAADAARRYRPDNPWRTAWPSLTRAAFTIPWNIAGFPAASVPAGTTSDGLPLAVQLVALPGRERTLLGLAADLQRAADWTARRPPL